MQPQINFLSPEEVERIHQAALWLLENVGMQMPSQEAVDIMRNAGARIEDENIVKIPPELVAHAVEKAPKRDGFVLYGRDEKHDIHFGQDTPVIGCMLEATHVIDLETKERRLCTDKDLADIVRLADALEHIGINGHLATPQNVRQETAELTAFGISLKNTSKHIQAAAYGTQWVRDSIKMAILAAGSEKKFRERPFIEFCILPRPPLQIDRLSLESLLEISRQSIPVLVDAGDILGMTAPVTLASGLAQGHAEILACLVLVQIVHPGAPFMYALQVRNFDMKNVNISMASPEFAILKGAAGQLGRYLNLPVWNFAMLRDSKILDAQAGFETGKVGLISVLTADVVWGMQYDMDTLVDFADLVFCNEAMAELKRIARGITVDDNTLALDVIKEVGHGGNFLGHQHTRQNFRKEIWVPHLMERRNWEQWERDGQKDIEQRAREKAKEILASHHPERLPPEVEAEIDRIVREAKPIMPKNSSQFEKKV